MGFINLDQFDLMCWKALEVRDIPNNIHTSIKRLRFAEALNFINAKIGTLVTEAARDGKLTFEGIEMPSSASSPNGRMQPIPPNYFRQPRQIIGDNTFQAYIDSGNYDESREARNGGEAHPNWSNVIVDKKQAEAFVRTLTPLARELAGKHDPLDTNPDGLRFTLSAAISHLAFGAAREPTELDRSKFSEADSTNLQMAALVIHEAARLGRVIIKGKLETSSELRRILQEEFERPLFLDWLANSIQEMEPKNGKPKRTWNGVMVMEETLCKWLQATEREKSEKNVAIWDFAFEKFSNDQDLKDRLVADIYSSFWKGGFAPDGLTLKYGDQEPVNQLTRFDLAVAAIDEAEFKSMEETAAFETLANWNMTNYRKIRFPYKTYFCPDDDGGHKRGLCADESELDAWFVTSPYGNLIQLSNHGQGPSTSEPSVPNAKKSKTNAISLAIDELGLVHLTRPGYSPKHRNKDIADWIVSKGLTVPRGNDALPKAVQRELRKRRQVL